MHYLTDGFCASKVPSTLGHDKQGYLPVGLGTPGVVNERGAACMRLRGSDRPLPPKLSGEREKRLPRPFAAARMAAHRCQASERGVAAGRLARETDCHTLERGRTSTAS